MQLLKTRHYFTTTTFVGNPTDVTTFQLVGIPYEPNFVFVRNSLIFKCGELVIFVGTKKGSVIRLPDPECVLNGHGLRIIHLSKGQHRCERHSTARSYEQFP
jgi:nitrous oxidase accessory protein NosD